MHQLRSFQAEAFVGSSGDREDEARGARPDEMAAWLPADSDADAAGLRGSRATDLPPLQEVPL